MTNNIKRRATSLFLASTLFAGSVSLAGCGSKNNEVKNTDNSIGGSFSESDKSTNANDDKQVINDSAASSSSISDPSDDELTKNDNQDTEFEYELPIEDDKAVADNEKQSKDEEEISMLGEAEMLIDPNGINYDIRGEYNLEDLYVIDASLLDDSLKGKSYITTTSSYSIIDGDKNLVFVCYPSINSDFVLVHQIAFINNEFSSVSYYSNISGGVSTDSNDMNTVISNAMIRPLSERVNTPLMSLEDLQALVKSINEENKLTLK